MSTEANNPLPPPPPQPAYTAPPPASSAAPPPYQQYGDAQPGGKNEGVQTQQPVPLPPLPVYPQQAPGIYAYYPPGSTPPGFEHQVHQGYHDGGAVYYVANRQVCANCGHDRFVEDLNMCMLMLLILLVICFFPIGILYLLLLPSVRERRCAQCMTPFGL